MRVTDDDIDGAVRARLSERVTNVEELRFARGWVCDEGFLAAVFASLLNSGGAGFCAVHQRERLGIVLAALSLGVEIRD